MCSWWWCSGWEVSSSWQQQNSKPDGVRQRRRQLAVCLLRLLTTKGPWRTTTALADAPKLPVQMHKEHTSQQPCVPILLLLPTSTVLLTVLRSGRVLTHSPSLTRKSGSASSSLSKLKAVMPRILSRST